MDSGKLMASRLAAMPFCSLHHAMIETDRLVLRPYQLADYDDYHAMCADPQVMQFLGRKPQSAEESWHRILRYAGHWSLLGYGLFAVREKASGRYIGETGLADFRRGLGDDFDCPAEAAWVFRSDAQGRGFAFEAAAAAHRWFYQERGRARSLCLIDPANRASLTLAKALGYQPFGDVIYKDHPAMVLERLPADVPPLNRV